MTINEYQALAMRTLNPELSKKDILINGVMGLCGESGEAIDIVKKHLAQGHDLDREALVKELGDVGNDLQIYGSKLYAVLNSSHKVEVMDARTLVRIGQIDIANCRYINFDKGNAYVTSYVGPIAIDPNAQPGAVYRVDTATLAITGKCTVGYQPEELTFIDRHIYIANSGGYRKPNYDNTISVVAMTTMKKKKKIAVSPNLHRIRKLNCIMHFIL